MESLGVILEEQGDVIIYNNQQGMTYFFLLFSRFIYKLNLKMENRMCPGFGGGGVSQFYFPVPTLTLFWKKEGWNANKSFCYRKYY